MTPPFVTDYPARERERVAYCLWVESCERKLAAIPPRKRVLLPRTDHKPSAKQIKESILRTL